MTPSERAMLRSFLAEDLGRGGDITSQCLVPSHQMVTVQLIANQRGVVAGLPYVRALCRLCSRRVRLTSHVREGTIVHRGQRIAQLHGPARPILAAERTALNLLGHLSGVATLTRQFVTRVRGTRTMIYDTRKTLPGLRHFDKYAVRIGGGQNHRLDLSQHVLIKTNHLKVLSGSRVQTIRESLYRARRVHRGPLIIEATAVEDVLFALLWRADVILLDNMPLRDLRRAIQLRNRLRPSVQLEASGGVTLRNIRAIARTGVERISVGALTKSAPTLDFALRVLPARGAV